MYEKIQVIRTPDGNGGYNVKIIAPAGDFIEIPALGDRSADAMAYEIAEIINRYSVLDARATWEI